MLWVWAIQKPAGKRNAEHHKSELAELADIGRRLDARRMVFAHHPRHAIGDGKLDDEANDVIATIKTN
jgi:hypothetical protein